MAAKLELPNSGPWTPENFLAFCEANPELRAELDAQGAIHIMSPSNADAEGKVSLIQGELYVWSKGRGAFKVFGSKAGFTLKNGAVRAPDVSLVEQVIWDALSSQARRSVAPVTPFSSSSCVPRNPIRWQRRVRK
ncbi:MAG: Uma2 family endonuclease [Candidatus Omnitrophota bacterium]|jgi:Uma2 family endonuclease